MEQTWDIFSFSSVGRLDLDPDTTLGMRIRIRIQEGENSHKSKEISSFEVLDLGDEDFSCTVAWTSFMEALRK